MNEVIAEIEDGQGAWLVYADSFHPGWKATINGQAVPIYEANVAFKAVHLKQGKNIVRLVFRDGLTYYASYLLAFLGVLAGLALLLGIGIAVNRKMAHTLDP